MSVSVCPVGLRGPETRRSWPALVGPINRGGLNGDCRLDPPFGAAFLWPALRRAPFCLWATMSQRQSAAVWQAGRRAQWATMRAQCSQRLTQFAVCSASARKQSECRALNQASPKVCPQLCSVRAADTLRNDWIFSPKCSPLCPPPNQLRSLHTHKHTMTTTPTVAPLPAATKSQLCCGATGSLLVLDGRLVAGYQ